MATKMCFVWVMTVLAIESGVGAAEPFPVVPFTLQQTPWSGVRPGSGFEPALPVGPVRVGWPLPEIERSGIPLLDAPGNGYREQGKERVLPVS